MVDPNYHAIKDAATEEVWVGKVRLNKVKPPSLLQDALRTFNRLMFTGNFPKWKRVQAISQTCVTSEHFFPRVPHGTNVLGNVLQHFLI